MDEQLQAIDQVTKVNVGVVLLYALAATAGAVGGCGAGSLLALKSKAQIRAVQLMAYAFIGLISGVVMIGFGHVIGIQVDDTGSLIRWALGAGVGVPIALFSHNFAISAVLKRFGWELQFTLRRGKQDRRSHGDGDD